MTNVFRVSLDVVVKTNHYIPESKQKASKRKEVQTVSDGTISLTN